MAHTVRIETEAGELPAGYSEGLLTAKQERIAYLVAQGLHDREIAEILALSVNTVKNYVVRIFDRCGVFSRVELALWFEKRRAEILGFDFSRPGEHGSAAQLRG
jgi:DNA-binding NarL/FixJ family response regulator